MKWYTYEGSAQLRVGMSRLLGIFSIVASTLLAALMAWHDFDARAPSILICVALWFLGFGWLFGTFSLWAYPDVQVGEHGLALRVLWMKLYVPWSDVCGMRTREFALGNIRLVYAKRITPFHILYGWYFAAMVKPGFFIAASIKDYYELIRAFHRHGVLE